MRKVISLKKKYNGIIPPIITPIDGNEKTDEIGFRKLIDFCIEGGNNGLFVAGTNGETMSMTQEERNRLIAIALDQSAGRVPVIAGIMDTSTKRVIENLKQLEQMGGKCAAITPVFYDRHTSQDETVRHFEQICKASNIDIFIYNIPSFTGENIRADTVLRIAKFDHIVGYKDSSGSYAAFAEVVAKLGKTEFSCLQGVTALGLPAVLMGADGFVPVLGALYPRMFAEAYDAAVRKDVELTVAYNDLIRESSKIMSMSKNATAAAKYAISTLGFTKEFVYFLFSAKFIQRFVPGRSCQLRLFSFQDDVGLWGFPVAWTSIKKRARILIARLNILLGPVEIRDLCSGRLRDVGGLYHRWHQNRDSGEEAVLNETPSLLGGCSCNLINSA